MNKVQKVIAAASDGLERWKVEQNIAYFQLVHNTLTDEGYYFYPLIGEVFTKAELATVIEQMRASID